MPWIPFTPDHVNSRMSAREVGVYEETSLAEYPEEGGEAVVPDDAAARMPQLIAQILAEFRGKIMANPKVTFLGPAGTLPDFCIGPAAVLVRTAMIGLPPVPEGMTNPRRDEYNDAKALRDSLTSLPASAFAEAEAAPAENPASSAVGGDPYLRF
jgi:hypothetical protein